MWDTIALLVTALAFGLGLVFWPTWKGWVLNRHRSSLERWHDAQDALGRATSSEESAEDG